VFAGYAFSDGGIFVYGVVIVGVLLYGGVAVQLVKRQTRRYAGLLWGGLIGMVLLGLLGTTVGLTQGMSALSRLAVESNATVYDVMGIALIPLTTALLLAVPAALLTGWTSMLGNRT